jgi:hypothetical protein
VPRPRTGASARCCSVGPLAGVSGAALVRRSFCFWGRDRMKSNQWHIRIGGETIGPLSSAELQDLADHRSITQRTPLSPDGNTWTTGGAVRGLSFPVDSPPPPPPRPPVPGGRTRIEDILTRLRSDRKALIASAIIAALLLIVLVAAASRSSNGTADRTYEYWSQVRQTIQAGAKIAKTDQGPSTSERCRSIAAAINNLPTAGVDEEAVRACLSAAALFDRRAEINEAITSPAFLFEVFVREANGDPFGASLDALSADSALKQRVTVVREQLTRTRALLSSRYGREFPPL